jgi:hypothetical protein
MAKCDLFSLKIWRILQNSKKKLLYNPRPVFFFFWFFVVAETSGFLFFGRLQPLKETKQEYFGRRCLIFFITKITSRQEFCFLRFWRWGWRYVAGDDPTFATFGQINIKSTLRCLWPPLTKLKRKNNDR